MEINVKELKYYANQLSEQYWNRKFNIEIEIVNREWKRRLGCYVIYPNGRKVIRFSKKTIEKITFDELIGTLKHELVHWHLHTSGQKFSDESPVFIEECLRIKAPISGTKIAQQARSEYNKNKLLETLKKNYG